MTESGKAPKGLHKRKWFLDRIGKRIYRDSDGCTCLSCREVVKNGLVIEDKDHAEYVYDIQIDFAKCGTILRYRDKK